jgi:multiple sugar transport system permease protein
MKINTKKTEKKIRIQTKSKKKMKWKQIELFHGSLFVLPSILILLFTSLIPLIYAFFVSFTNLNFAVNPDGSFIGLNNYTNAFNDQAFLHSMRITIIFVVITVLCETILGMLLALLFTRGGKSFSVTRTLIITPMVATPVVIGILWKIMLNTDYGVINYFLSFFGISKIDWLGDPFLAFISVMIVDIWEWTPFMILVFIAALISIPKNMIEAATIDGANSWNIFWKIKLPSIMPIVLVSVLLRFIDAFKVVDTVYVMTYGGPGNSTRLLSMFIYQEALKYFKIGYGSAISILFILLMFVLSFYFVRQRLKA